MNLYCPYDQCPSLYRLRKRSLLAVAAQDGTDVVLQCRHCKRSARCVVENGVPSYYAHLGRAELRLTVTRDPAYSEAVQTR